MKDIISIRPARFSDCVRCQRLGRVPEIAIAPQWYLPLAYYRKVVREKHIFQVAEINRQVVGFVIAEKIVFGYLAQYIVVDKKYRRTGIGRQLLASMEHESKRRRAWFLLGYAVKKSTSIGKLLDEFGYRRGQITQERSKGIGE